MFNVGLPEVLIVALAVGLLFGPEKMSGIAHSIGRFTGEFRKGHDEITREVRSLTDTIIVDDVGE